MCRFNPRSCCNSSSGCCYRAHEHVHPASSCRIRHGGDSHPEMPSSPGSVGLARAYRLTKTQAMEPSRQTWSGMLRVYLVTLDREPPTFKWLTHACACEHTHTPVGIRIYCVVNEYRWLYHVLKFQNDHLLDIFSNILVWWYWLDHTSSIIRQ